MRKLGATAAMVIAIVALTPAYAAPIYMTCQGLMTITQGPEGGAVSVTGGSATLSVSIDAGIVMIVANGTSYSVPITSLPNDTLLAFASPGILAKLNAGTFVGVSSGTLNRTTGAANIYLKLPNKTATQFMGNCMPTQRP
jgi:hypothetical protein